jgi:UDP-glucuronate decarboxylase
MIRMMGSREEFTGPVNLGNPVEFTILQLAEMVKKMTNSSSEIIHLPLPQDDPAQRQPNIDLAKKELNWKPSIPLEEGLKKTIDYFKTLV